MNSNLQPEGFDRDFLKKRGERLSDILEEEEKKAEPVSSEQPTPTPIQQAAPKGRTVDIEPDKQGPLTEVVNAATKGFRGAIESTLTATERFFDAARGEDISSDDYQLDWDPMAKVPEPYVGTWWGSLIEDVVHYSTYSGGLLLLSGGRLAGLNPRTFSALSAGVGAALSNKSDEGRILSSLKETSPVVEKIIERTGLDLLAADDADHPLLKKFKAISEEMGLALISDYVVVKLFGKKGLLHAAMRQRNVSDQIIEKGRAELNDTLSNAAKAAKSPQHIAMRGHMNKPLAEPWQGSPNSTADAGEIHQQLNRIDSEFSAKDGSTDAVLTPLEAERMATTSGLSEELLQKKAAELLSSPRYAALKLSINKGETSWAKAFWPAYRRHQQVMGRVETAKTPEEFWEPILKRQNSRYEKFKYWSDHNVVVADLVIGSLMKQIRDLSSGALELSNIADIKDTDGPLKTIADRLIFGLAQTKRSRYLIGAQLNNLKGPTGSGGAKVKKAGIRKTTAGVAGEMPTEAEIRQRLIDIDNETRETVQTVLTLAGKSGNEDLLKALIEAFAMTDNIHTMLDLDLFMRKRLRGFSSQNQTLAELSSFFVNSVLSAPKTPVRAFLGTGQAAFLQPMTRAIGATARGDWVTARSNIAAMNAFTGMVPEAWSVFNRRAKANFSRDINSIETRFSSRQRQSDAQWAALGKWVESRGSDGDKASYYLGKLARGLNDNRIFSASSRLMASFDETYAVILGRARAKEKAMRQVLDNKTQKIDRYRYSIAGDKVKRRKSSSEITADDLALYEDIFFREMLNKDGTVKLDSDLFLKADYQEATLTEPLTAFGKDLNQLFEKWPLMKPFFLFARTGISGLNLTFKNAPGLGLLHRKHLDIMYADVEDLENLARYGIFNAADLDNAKAQIAGRQLVGTAVVFAGAVAYMSDNLTGNGPQDRGLREVWRMTDWQPRRIRVGDVWLSHDVFDPYSTILTTLADIGDNSQLMGPKWTEDKYQKLALAVGGSMVSKSYLSGINDLIDAFSGGHGAGSRIWGNIANNAALVPIFGAGMRNSIGKVLSPYMRELDDEISDSIRNRNLTTEYFSDKPLPIKYNLLRKGKPLREWGFWQRAFNEATGLNIDVADDSPGGQLLRDSNYDLRLLTKRAPDGTDLSNSSRLRSMFQLAISEQNIGEKLDALAERKDVQDSLDDMESDRENNRLRLDPMQTYVHNRLIRSVIKPAVRAAWQTMKSNPEVTTLIEEDRQLNLDQIKRRLSQRKPPDFAIPYDSAGD
ncbi:hypothetical protein OMCYN_01647 [cyanobiont of Ornithocercus magnificus]|nr:hypothetical protein OMCYN_01647 [cyanobiont of Ornithocercus magnificus]